MKSKPTLNQLVRHAPMHIWDAAEKQASRSIIKQFKTGAVLFDRRGAIVSRGCSHKRDSKVPRDSVHAEQHALMCYGDLSELTCVIVTTAKLSGNWAGSSRPCAFCTHLLYNAGVSRVIYAERSCDGEWTINNETVKSLYERADLSLINATYTRDMRVA